jgi:hypothetical protein
VFNDKLHDGPQILPTGLSVFPEQQRLETYVGDLALIVMMPGKKHKETGNPHVSELSYS